MKLAGAYRRVGWTLSHVGQRLGVDALTYNPVVFEFFHSAAKADAPAVVRTLMGLFPDASSWVDVGAGSGAFAAQAQRAGLRVEACEHGRPGRRWAGKQGVQARPFDLKRHPPAELTGPFDLAYCFEVAEHLPPAAGERLVAFLSELAPLVVFTAAQPGQGGIGHINEQPASYWIGRFEAHSRRLDKRLTDAVSRGFADAPSPWLSNNVMVFVR